MSDNGNAILADKLRELCRKHHGVWHEKSLLELIQSHADAQTAELRSQLSECQREREEARKQLESWTMKIRPLEDLLDAFADQIHHQYISFRDGRGCYEHRMDVIKSAMRAFCKAILIEHGHAEQQLQQMKEALGKIIDLNPPVVAILAKAVGVEPTSLRLEGGTLSS